MATSKQNVTTISDGLATSVDICRLFDLNQRTVAKRLASLSPVVRKGTYNYYRLTEALPLLVKPKNVGEYLKTMSHHDLPKDLTKEYWAGQRSKQIFLREAGDLWPTNDVVDKVSDSFKTVAMKLRLLSDEVSRLDSLTDAQKLTIDSVVDATLAGIAKDIESKFQRRPETLMPLNDVDFDDEDDEDEPAEIDEDDQEL